MWYQTWADADVEVEDLPQAHDGTVVDVAFVAELGVELFVGFLFGPLLGGRLAPIYNWSSIMGLYRGPGLGNFGRDFGAIFGHGQGRFVCETQGN